jgi:hypothetical protein
VVPHHRVQPPAVARVQHHLGGAGELVGAGEHPPPGGTAVGGAVHAALAARVVERTGGRDEDPPRVGRVDGDGADRAGVGQPEPAPGPAGVSRDVETGALVGDAAATGVDLSGAGVHGAVGCRGHRAHGLGQIRRPGRLEPLAGVAADPQATAGRGRVDRVGPPGVERERGDPATDVGRPHQGPPAARDRQPARGLRRLGERVPGQRLTPERLLQMAEVGRRRRPADRPVLVRRARRAGGHGPLRHRGGRHRRRAGEPHRPEERQCDEGKGNPPRAPHDQSPSTVDGWVRLAGTLHVYAPRWEDAREGAPRRRRPLDSSAGRVRR